MFCLLIRVLPVALLLYPLISQTSEITVKDRVLHFDQSQVSFESLNFKHDEELKPVANDFKLIEVAYLSNEIGERWAFITFKNLSSGQRLLKNEYIVATFVDGSQAYAENLNEAVKGNEILTRAVFFGLHQFPIANVKLE